MLLVPPRLRRATALLSAAAVAAGGTLLTALDGSLRSGRTGFTYLSCTRQIGRERSNSVATVDAVPDNLFVDVGAVATTTAPSATTPVGSTARSPPTRSRTSGSWAPGSPPWADHGTLHASTNLGAANISLTVLPGLLSGGLGKQDDNHAAKA